MKNNLFLCIADLRLQIIEQFAFDPLLSIGTIGSFLQGEARNCKDLINIKKKKKAK